MRANPGGSLDTKDVLGRDGLIQLIWDTLEIKSVRLEAERRIGKTSIIRKMRDEPHGGWSPIYMELERIQSGSLEPASLSRSDQYLLPGPRQDRLGDPRHRCRVRCVPDGRRIPQFSEAWRTCGQGATPRPVTVAGFGSLPDAGSRRKARLPISLAAALVAT